MSNNAPLSFDELIDKEGYDIASSHKPVNAKIKGTTIRKNPVDILKVVSLYEALVNVGANKKRILLAFMKTYQISTREARELFNQVFVYKKKKKKHALQNEEKRAKQ